jgi:hypothetical protein
VVGGGWGGGGEGTLFHCCEKGQGGSGTHTKGTHDTLTQRHTPPQKSKKKRVLEEEEEVCDKVCEVPVEKKKMILIYNHVL